ncbi:DUF6941 family protein [Salinicoccus siamensis]|uniref:DUF6941 family protein n=1 Tax=Salinicoccus siamensis TaxID=381830 RepID=A0ABV5Z1L6_9STAP
MPKITTFVYAEEISNTRDNKLNIVNPLNVFRPAFVPGMFSFSVVIGIIGLDVTQGKHTLRIKFYGEDQKETPLIDTGYVPLEDVPTGPLSLPSELRGMMGSMDFRNVVMKSEGVYITEVFVDGDLLGEFPIHVLAGESV